MRSHRLLAATALTAVPFLLATAASAQTAPQPTQTDDPSELSRTEVELQSGQAATSDDAIIITGSRLNRPNLDSVVPITSVGPTELVQQGSVSLGDSLNELPSLRSTFSQSNSTRFIGTAGVNWLDLYGLGTSRTLVLQNGRRHITSTPGSYEVDTNTIPTDLLERVDIITGGNSAVYGSDAVAGVANFILKTDFEGLAARFQGGVSDRGDRGQYFASITGGRNFADNRGNVALSVEYARQNELLVTARNEQTGAFSGQIGYFATQNTLNEPATGDGIPDNSFLRNVRSNQFGSGGGVVVGCPATAASGETPEQFAARRALVCTGLNGPGGVGSPLAYGFFFTNDGRLVRNDAAAGVTADLRQFAGNNVIGGLGSTFQETGQIYPQLDRFAANLLFSFEFSPAAQLFFEGKYVRVDAIQESSPTFQSGTLPVATRRDNAFLTPGQTATLNQILAPTATAFTLVRNNVDFGARAEDHRRETYRFVGGLRGNISDRFRYEVSLNYGRFESYYETGGNVLIANYVRAQDAVLAPASFTGTNFALTPNGTRAICRVNLTTNVDPNCVPLNLFGDGSPSQAALDYVLVDSFRNEKAEQYNAIAFVSGDTGGFFNLPGGPLRFAVGGEYRREEASSIYDPIISAPTRLTFLNAIAPFTPPALNVYEGFGEVELPILADLPFVNELTLTGSGRVSKYSAGPEDAVFAYNAGLIYSPFEGLRIRGGYARAVRAPTLGDLFATETQTFAAITDPCSQTRIRDNPNRVANCAAAGVPTTFTLTNPDGTTRTVPFINAPTSTPAGANRGNPNAQEERSDSWTLGAVFTPAFLPGFNVTVDYFNIDIKNVISSLGGQTVVNLCYDSPSGVDNQYCNAVFRRPDGTFAGQAGITIGGETITYPDVSPSFFSQPFNFANFKSEGINFDAAYRTNLGEGDMTLNLRLFGTYILNRENYTDVTQPDFATRLHGTLGDPIWNVSANATLGFGDVDLLYRFALLGEQTIGTWQQQNSHQGRPPENPDVFPEVRYPTITYHSLRASWQAQENFRFYTGVDNVFDQLPPARSGLFGTGAGGAIYPPLGRYFYAGGEITF